jgi:hypothetical protein
LHAKEAAWGATARLVLPGGSRGPLADLARGSNHVKPLDAIAEVLGDATSESIAAEVGPAADATRSTVLLKMAVVRLEPIRTPDRIHVKKLVKAGAGLDQLLEVIREIASPDELEQRVREAWTDASAVLDREWDRRKLELAPGEEVLDTIWKAHGRRYDKGRDGPRIAAVMDQPPAELVDVIDSLAET